MDGTMVDTNPWHKKAYEVLLKKYNTPFSEQYFNKNIIGHKNSEIFSRLFPTMNRKEIVKITNEKEEIFRNLYQNNVREVNGLSSLITNSKDKGLLIAIATTASKKNRECILKGLKFPSSWFSVMVGEEDVVNGKPNPEIYLKTAEKLDVEPNKCIVFEDSKTGILAGKSAGMTVVAVFTNKMPETLKEADYIVNDFSEIELIEN